jgi:hypothetical protein
MMMIAHTTVATASPLFGLYWDRALVIGDQGWTDNRTQDGHSRSFG